MQPRASLRGSRAASSQVFARTSGSNENDIEAQRDLRNSGRRPPNPQPAHQTAKCVGMDVEDGSGAVGSADHPAGSLEHLQNMLALYNLK